MSAPTMGALSPWQAVREEIVTVLSTVSDAQMSNAAALFTDRHRRWFCSGQGRSGLVAQMVAMRLMHVGFDAHAVGEATAPAIGSSAPSLGYGAALPYSSQHSSWGGLCQGSWGRWLVRMCEASCQPTTTRVARSITAGRCSQLRSCGCPSSRTATRVAALALCARAGQMQG
jgi:hypothetical protein